MSKHEFKVGDLVRVQGAARHLPRRHPNDIRHNLKAGAVAVVMEIDADGDVWVRGPSDYDGKTLMQVMRPSQVKLAKQAMKKRAAYGARRG